MFTVNPACYGSVFVVPAAVVDRYIKFASAVQLKTLLWILKNQGADISAAVLSKAVGFSEGDTADALLFWKNEGILAEVGAPAVPAPAVPIAPAVPAVTSAPAQAASEAKPAPETKKESEALPDLPAIKPTYEQVLARLEESKEIQLLFTEAQQTLGRTIGYDMQATLLMMLDTYGLKEEIILTVLHYCASQGKASAAYIAKMSKDWAKREIDTLEKAAERIEQIQNADKLFAEFKILAGISAPKATTAQSEYLLSWHKMGFSVEMMHLAYEETVNRTGKMNFNYTNRILENWYRDNLKSPEAVEEFRENRRREADAKAQKPQTAERKPSYDLEKAKHDAKYKPIKYVKKEKKAGN